MRAPLPPGGLSQTLPNSATSRPGSLPARLGQPSRRCPLWDFFFPPSSPPSLDSPAHRCLLFSADKAKAPGRSGQANRARQAPTSAALYTMRALGEGGEISSGRCPSLRTPCSERISAPGAWHQSCPRTFPHPYAGTGHGLSGSQRPPGAGGAPRSIPPLYEQPPLPSLGNCV